MELFRNGDLCIQRCQKGKVMNSQKHSSNPDSAPVFSVVIPCYNEEAGLSELIARCEFVAKQGNGEFILVNNGSTDNTDAVLKQLLDNNKYVRYVTVAVNRGYGFGITEGLNAANAPIIGWTHADLQTDPADVLRAIPIFMNSKSDLFVKGRRYGRPFADRVFTAGMSVFETLLLGKKLSDINAQPTLFSSQLLESWGNPPSDFSLDLFAFAKAKKAKIRIIRFPVIFAERKYGASSWNVDFRAKWKFIKRTLAYSFSLRKKI